MLKKEFIHLNLNCENAQEAMRILAQSFVDSSVVKESFIEAVIEREKVYPTGLPASAFNIAIPHTVSEHVLMPAMAIGVMTHPLEVQQMGSPEITLEAQLFIMLAISDPKEQTALLRRIMKLLQNDELLTQVRDAADAETVLSLLEPALIA